MNEPINMTDINDGATKELEVGKTLIIQLNEIPTTGYRWTLQVSDTAAIEVTDRGWQPEHCTGVGGGGHRVFCLAARKKGQFQVNLKLLREWQGEGSVIESHHFTLLTK